MKLFFLFTYIGVLATSNAASLHKNFPNFAATETPACSSDPSKAFLDVIVLIDTSANMGSSNVRKITTMLTTIFQGFPIGNQWDITQGYRNTRIAVVTYDQQARVVANYTQINGINDLTTVVSGIQASSSQVADLYDGLVKTFLLDTNCTDITNCSECILNDWRPTAYLLFAASSNSPNFNSIYNIVWDTDFFTDGTFITVNFNTADSALTNLLAKMTSIEINNDVTASMYNFPSSNAQLTTNIIWSLTQGDRYFGASHILANCYCGDFGSYTQYIYFDSTNSRYARTRNCFTTLEEFGGTEASPMTLCNFIAGLAGTPTFILSPANAKTIQDLSFYPGCAYYMGLHKNAQGQWSWYDFDGSEFPLGSYTNWAPGYPDNSANGCAIITADATNTSMVWKTYDCSPMNTGLRMSLCQGLGCDATSVSCCANCNGGNLESCKIDMVKRKKLNNRRKGIIHNLH